MHFHHHNHKKGSYSIEDHQGLIKRWIPLIKYFYATILDDKNVKWEMKHFSLVQLLSELDNPFILRKTRKGIIDQYFINALLSSKQNYLIRLYTNIVQIIVHRL